jgi:phage terminase large subunit-like protein
MTHVKGELAGHPFEIEPWFKAVVANIFGWVRADGTRRYREVFLYVPRKNGKSILASSIANLVFFTDQEPGAEIYMAAAEREQASIVFNVAKAQINNDPILQSKCNIQKYVVTSPDEMCVMRAVSSDGATKHGFNPHCVIVDEVHVHNSPDLIEAFETGIGARRQPLIIYLTTADYQRESICNTKYKYACAVRDGIIKDPYFLPVIYEASIDDDWTDPTTWAKANPNFGLSVKTEMMERACQKAIDVPSSENSFKRFHLNIITEAVNRFFSMTKWDRCTGITTVDQGNTQVEYQDAYIDWVEQLKDRPCYAGLDLASTTDVAALSLVFPPEEDDEPVKTLMFFWIPSDNAVEREKKDKVPYTTWRNQNFITMTEGNVIDYDVIRKTINDLAKTYNLMDIAVDKWNASQLITQLQGDGLNVLAYSQSFNSFNEPTKELERLVTAKELDHAGNPVLRWMAANTNVKAREDGYIKPVKPEGKLASKIDGIVALIMGIGRMIVRDENAGKSVYDTRGIRQL